MITREELLKEGFCETDGSNSVKWMWKSIGTGGFNVDIEFANDEFHLMVENEYGLPLTFHTMEELRQFIQHFK